MGTRTRKKLNSGLPFGQAALVSPSNKRRNVQCTLLNSKTNSFSILCRYLAGDALDSDDSDDDGEDDDDDQPDEFDGSCDDKRKPPKQIGRDVGHISNACSITAARTTPSSYAKVREHQPKAFKADPSTATASKRGSPSISLPASRLQ